MASNWCFAVLRILLWPEIKSWINICYQVGVPLRKKRKNSLRSPWQDWSNAAVTGRFLGDFLGETMLCFSHNIYIFSVNSHVKSHKPTLLQLKNENLKWKYCFLKITRARFKVSRRLKWISIQNSHQKCPLRFNFVW